MNIGDYVRTKDGGIGKIIKCPFKSMYLDEIWGDIENTETIITDNVYKTSPNIIDLIEVGDILSFEDGSICRIMEIDNDLNPPYYLLKDYGGDTYWERQEYLSDLKSIVTKEQFESMEYKL